MTQTIVDEVTQLNVVTCGNCGEPFAHKLPLKKDDLTCPYCRFKDDISSFPDMFYPPEHDDSIINLPVIPF